MNNELDFETVAFYTVVAILSFALGLLSPPHGILCFVMGSAIRELSR